MMASSWRAVPQDPAVVAEARKHCPSIVEAELALQNAAVGIVRSRRVLQRRGQPLVAARNMLTQTPIDPIESLGSAAPMPPEAAARAAERARELERLAEAQRAYERQLRDPASAAEAEEAAISSRAAAAAAAAAVAVADSKKASNAPPLSISSSLALASSPPLVTAADRARHLMEVYASQVTPEEVFTTDGLTPQLASFLASLPEPLREQLELRVRERYARLVHEQAARERSERRTMAKRSVFSEQVNDVRMEVRRRLRDRQNHLGVSVLRCKREILSEMFDEAKERRKLTWREIEGLDSRLANIFRGTAFESISRTGNRQRRDREGLPGGNRAVIMGLVRYWVHKVRTRVAERKSREAAEQRAEAARNRAKARAAAAAAAAAAGGGGGASGAGGRRASAASTASTATGNPWTRASVSVSIAADEAVEIPAPPSPAPVVVVGSKFASLLRGRVAGSSSSSTSDPPTNSLSALRDAANRVRLLAAPALSAARTSAVASATDLVQATQQRAEARRRARIRKARRRRGGRRLHRQSLGFHLGADPFSSPGYSRSARRVAGTVSDGDDLDDEDDPDGLLDGDDDDDDDDEDDDGDPRSRSVDSAQRRFANRRRRRRRKLRRTIDPATRSQPVWHHPTTLHGASDQNRVRVWAAEHGVLDEAVAMLATAPAGVRRVAGAHLPQSVSTPAMRRSSVAVPRHPAAVPASPVGIAAGSRATTPSLRSRPLQLSRTHSATAMQQRPSASDWVDMTDPWTAPTLQLSSSIQQDARRPALDPSAPQPSLVSLVSMGSSMQSPGGSALLSPSNGGSSSSSGKLAMMMMMDPASVTDLALPSLVRDSVRAEGSITGYVDNSRLFRHTTGILREVERDRADERARRERAEVQGRRHAIERTVASRGHDSAAGLHLPHTTSSKSMGSVASGSVGSRSSSSAAIIRSPTWVQVATMLPDAPLRAKSPAVQARLLAGGAFRDSDTRAAKTVSRRFHEDADMEPLVRAARGARGVSRQAPVPSATIPPSLLPSQQAPYQSGAIASRGAELPGRQLDGTAPTVEVVVLNARRALAMHERTPTGGGRLALTKMREDTLQRIRTSEAAMRTGVGSAVLRTATASRQRASSPGRGRSGARRNAGASEEDRVPTPEARDESERHSRWWESQFVHDGLLSPASISSALLRPVRAPSPASPPSQLKAARSAAALEARRTASAALPVRPFSRSRALATLPGRDHVPDVRQVIIHRIGDKHTLRSAGKTNLPDVLSTFDPESRDPWA